MKILAVMNHQANAGNTNAIATYIRVAPTYGHSVAIYGSGYGFAPDLQFSTDVERFERVLYLYESERHRLSPLQEAAILAKFPRRHRMILDVDGMYNPVVNIDGYDFNHRSEADHVRWINYIDAVGERVMQPTLGCSAYPRVSPLTFYGYDETLQVDDPLKAPPKRYDILHVGHNYRRWRQVSTELLPAIEQVRDRVGEIGFIGLGWERSHEDEFRRLKIHTAAAVMYYDVIRTMSSARINILTQRPLLLHLKHLTLKYFEVFCADTIPLLMIDHDHAEAVYGPAGRELVLSGDVAAKLLDALHRPNHYTALVEEVRRHLVTHYPYGQRVSELVAAMGD